MADEKISEEPTKQTEQDQTSPELKGLREMRDLVEKNEKLAERIENAVKQQAEAASIAIMGGTTDNTPEKEPKPLTDKEYREALIKGEIPLNNT